jgi:selenocysteine lyase/cysteine desulfurase
MTDRRTFLGSLGALSAYACTRAAAVPRSSAAPRDLVASNDFAFTPGLTYLQTGSLGPSPRQVVDRALEVWKQLEADPTTRGYGELQAGMEVVRGKAAALLGCTLDELVLTKCTTEGMNWVAQGLTLKPGDRILTTDQEHEGGRMGWDFVAKRYGAAIDVVAIPPGENDAGAIIERFTKAVTPRTVAFSFSHVLSSTGLRMPVAELSAVAHKAGALAIVDGAQAAGSIPLDVKALGCDAYATSGHKWLLGPPGTGMLYLSKDLGDRVQIITLEDGHAAYTHSTGVSSIPSVHGLGAAIDYMTAIGIPQVLAYNLELHKRAHAGLSTIKKLRVVSPADGPLVSPMLTYVLPPEIPASDLGARLYKNHQIEIKGVPPRWLNGHRVSTHIFNSAEDVDRLVAALEQELPA